MRRPRPEVNRRDLLRLRSLGNQIASTGTSPTEVAVRGTDLLRAHRPAMGSFFEVRLGASVPGALELATRALDLIDELEAQLTVYRDDSEVSRVNATAHLAPVVVADNLFDLLACAVELSRQTGGAYDVTTGALSEAWGFVRGPKRVPDPETLELARARTGWRLLRLDPGARTVAFDRPGITLNLGSIGKGHAVDRAVDVIRSHWLPTSALIHGGQSSLFGLGSPPGRFGDRWEIALRNPWQPDAPLGVLRIRNRGLGTSGGTFQQFVSDGRVYGHLLDPRTGEPGQGPASVTVLAPTAADADALSTAFYLMDVEAVRTYVSQHPEVSVIIVSAEGDPAVPQVRTFGLGPEDFRIEPGAVNSVMTT